VTSANDPVTTARYLLTERSLCPGCHAPLFGSRCPECGLDLSGPAADELWYASVAAADALDRRSERLRALSAQARAGAVAYGSPPVAAASTSAPVAPAAPVSPAAPVPAGAPVPVPPRAAWPASPAPAARPWRVQTVLQMLGAGLLAAACIVFLVVAWGSFPLTVRALVIGLSTVLVFGAASFLRRRDLPQGAEAVAALAVVLLLLDAWAVRRTGLIGSGPTWAYWAAALTACAGLLALWGRYSRLVTGDVGGAALWLIAPLPLAGWRPGLAALPWVALLAVAAAAVRFVPSRPADEVPVAVQGPDLGVGAARRQPGRLVLTWGAAAAWGLGGLVATVLAARGETGWVAPAQLAALAATAGATTLLARRSAGRDLATAPAWATAAGVAAVLTVAAAALAATSGAGGVVRLGAATAAAALLAATTALARPSGTLDRTVAGVLATAGTLVGLSCLATAVVVVGILSGASSDPVPPAVAAAGVAAGALAAGLHGALRGLAEAARVCVALTVTAVVAATVAATASAPRPWPATLALLALSGLGVTVDLLLSRQAAAGTTSPLRLWRHGARGASVAAAVLALGAANHHRAATGLALAALGMLTLTARRWHAEAPPVATCLGGLLAASGAGFLLVGAGLPAEDAVALAAAAGALALGAVTFVVPRIAPSERIAACATAAGTAALGWTAGVATGTPATTAPVAVALLLVGATLWRGHERVAADAVTVAVAAAAPLTSLVAPTLRATAWPALPATGAVLAAAALGAASVLLAHPAARRFGPASRGAAEGGGALVLAGAFATAWLVGPDVAALVLLVAAVAALGIAVLPDRRPLRWAALGLAAAASWTLLGARDVGVAEAYLAPPGLVLTAVGALRARRGADGAVGVLGGGLGLALLPTALLRGSIALGDVRIGRIWVTCLAAAVLTLVALLAARRRVGSARPAWRPVWLVAGAAGVLGVLGPFREAVIAATRAGVEVPEGWAVYAAAVLAAAAYVVAIGPAPDPGRWWPAALVPALVAATAPSVRAVGPGAVGELRAVAVFAVAGAVAVLVLRAHLAGSGGRAGLPAATGTSVAIAAFAALAASARATGTPGDVPLVVLGALLLVLGVQWLLARREAGTWPALGAGLACTLVVPTLVGLGEHATWRPVYLVVAGVGAVACAAVLRWQAPFVVGGAVLLVVAVAQLGPWAGTVLTAAHGWPLLAIGGGVLLGLGLTYERRLAQAREAVRLVAAMR